MGWRFWALINIHSGGVCMFFALDAGVDFRFALAFFRVGVGEGGFWFWLHMEQIPWSSILYSENHDKHVLDGAL